MVGRVKKIENTGEHVETIGEILRDARLAKGLTIQELQKITKIQTRYLEALEEDHFDVLPGTYYARNFIRQYAQAVNVDGEKLIELFDSGAPIKKNVESVTGSRSEINKSRKNNGNSVKSRWPMILLSLVSLCLLGVVLAMMLRENSSKKYIESSDSMVVEGNLEESSSKKETSKETSTSSSESVESTASSETEKKEQKMEIVEGADKTSAVTITNAKKPTKLHFESTGGRCWLGVMVNGEYIYNKTIEIGTSDEFVLPEGTESATLVLGAAPNVKVEINDQALEFNKNNTNKVQRNLDLTIAYATSEASEEE